MTTSYLAKIESGFDRAARFVRLESATPARQSVVEFVKNPSLSTLPVGLVGGAVAGAFVGRHYKQPWWLGALLGGSVGRNATSLFRTTDRGSAVRNIAQTGVGVVGAKLTGDSLFGFAVSWLLGGAAIHMYDSR